MNKSLKEIKITVIITADIAVDVQYGTVTQYYIDAPRIGCSPP